MTNITQGPKVYPVDFEDFLDFVAKERETKEFLDRLRELAKKRGEFLYFAGGVVRDYLLSKKGKLNPQSSKDFDIVLEGNLEEFLQELNGDLKKEILLKSQFFTYKVRFFLDGEPLEVDFITARREVYEEIAQLPKVFPSNFMDDLLRRDFTINALAIGLSAPYEGLLLDPLDGKNDLEASLVKPLHHDSFVEDPTRIFRGIRYKVRLGFDFSEEFYQALEACYQKEGLKKLSSARLANELRLYLFKEGEDILLELLETTYQLGVFEKAGLEVARENFPLFCEVLKEVKEEFSPKEREKVYFLGMVESLSGLERLGFSEVEITRIESLLHNFRGFYHKINRLSLKERLEWFDKVRREYLCAFAVIFPELKEEILRYLKIYSKVRPELNGEDLKKLGFKPGKEIGELLKILRLKRVEGTVKTKEDEIEFLRKFLVKNE
ncbi:CCA tRNA nucleotidyltransferase [Thermodesulfobacterium hveragerdense]|uniref:CCA tRNA nucleotidyltransferase n=1 Tax=Thermodesulfobacterium hveragerdense TaxID=53424 RepID=UPI0004285DDC|nr:CCA tRNA nucleotidyltransferase [Thermodesulfobacterium hveragerdense]